MVLRARVYLTAEWHPACSSYYSITSLIACLLLSLFLYLYGQGRGMHSAWFTVVTK